jgi:hypothetical protein
LSGPRADWASSNTESSVAFPLCGELRRIMPKLATLAAQRKSIEAFANERPSSIRTCSISASLLSASGC